MTKELAGQDETYKYIIKTLNVRFFRRLGYEAEEVVFLNVEQIPIGSDQKFMDIFAMINGEYKGKH